MDLKQARLESVRLLLLAGYKLTDANFYTEARKLESYLQIDFVKSLHDVPVHDFPKPKVSSMLTSWFPSVLKRFTKTVKA